MPLKVNDKPERAHRPMQKIEMKSPPLVNIDIPIPVIGGSVVNEPLVQDNGDHVVEELSDADYG